VTLEEARRNIGSGVVYSPIGGNPEDGEITSVNDAYAFVRFTGDQSPKAVSPAALSLLSAALEASDA
jgi:hypothetical protein